MRKSRLIAAWIVVVGVSLSAWAAEKDNKEKEVQGLETHLRKIAKQAFDHAVEEIQKRQDGRVAEGLSKKAVYVEQKGEWVFNSEKVKQEHVEKAKQDTLNLSSARDWLKALPKKQKYVGAHPSQGDFGRVSSAQAKIIQVIDKSNALIEITESHRRYIPGVVDKITEVDKIYWIKTRTKGWVSGERWSGDDNFYLVSGTKTYRTAVGGTKTVPVMHRMTKYLDNIGSYMPVKTRKELEKYLVFRHTSTFG